MFPPPLPPVARSADMLLTDSLDGWHPRRFLADTASPLLARGTGSCHVLMANGTLTDNFYLDLKVESFGYITMSVKSY